MQITVSRVLLGSAEWEACKKEAQLRIDQDVGLRDNGIHRCRAMERLRRALEIPGVENVTLTDDEAVMIGLTMRKM